MPPLSNPKYERFAQELAKGETADEAYVLAGYSENRGNATRLKANESVRARVEEIVAEVSARVVKRTGYSKEWIIEQLAANSAAAQDMGKFEASNSALKMIGSELHNMFVAKTEVGNPGDFAARMTDDELRQYVENEARALGVGAAGVEAAARTGKAIAARRLN